MDKLTKIEIWWRGPFTLEEIKKDFSDLKSSYGIYQVYGTHNISGPNTLLYIGKSRDQTFATRIPQHDWVSWEASPTTIYLGQLGGVNNVDAQQWSQLIDEAEKLLIYFCAPPYNSQNLISYGEIHNTIVLNFDKKNRLPLEVSTFYNDSKFWGNDDNWKEYTIEEE